MTEDDRAFSIPPMYSLEALRQILRRDVPLSPLRRDVPLSPRSLQNILSEEDGTIGEIRDEEITRVEASTSKRPLNVIAPLNNLIRSAEGEAEGEGGVKSTSLSSTFTSKDDAENIAPPIKTCLEKAINELKGTEGKIARLPVKEDASRNEEKTVKEESTRKDGAVTTKTTCDVCQKPKKLYSARHLKDKQVCGKCWFLTPDELVSDEPYEPPRKRQVRRPTGNFI